MSLHPGEPLTDLCIYFDTADLLEAFACFCSNSFACCSGSNPYERARTFLKSMPAGETPLDWRVIWDGKFIGLEMKT